MDRREFVQIAGLAAVSLSGGKTPAVAQRNPEFTSMSNQPAPAFDGQFNTSDIIVETLIAWGATHVFGIVGDGINSIIEALRKRQDRITYVGVRHEEAAAFMASGLAKLSGRLGVCLATTGPGAVHLMNGLYDAKMDNAPVLAITGTTFHDLEGMSFVQSVNTQKLMQDVALFDEEVTGPANAVMLVNRACRAALSGRGVAHLTVPKDAQDEKLASDKVSPENHGGRTSSSWQAPAGTPPQKQLQAAAAVLNAGNRTFIMAGRGCFGAEAELVALAEKLKAPVAKAYLAKSLLPDAHPLTTGGIGHLGTAPSQWAVGTCDSVVILGTTMPWINYYPRPGQARGVQIDIKAEHIGLKYPVEVGLTGDMGETLRALLPMLHAKSDGAFLADAQARMRSWRGLLTQVESSPKSEKLLPQAVLRKLGELAPAGAIFTLDCGANTHFAARHLEIKQGQLWTGSGTLVSMGSALPMAVAASFLHPSRPCIAIAGDGGFAMLMCELSTAVHHKLNVRVLVLNNDSLAQVKSEQREIGNPEFGCDLGHIDFAAFAESAGAQGFRADSVAELSNTMQAWLNASGVALLDIQVDPDALAPEPDKLTV